MSKIAWIPSIAVEVHDLSANSALVFCTELITGYKFNAYITEDRLVQIEFDDINTPEQDDIKQNLMVNVEYIADLLLDSYKGQDAV